MLGGVEGAGDLGGAGSLRWGGVREGSLESGRGYSLSKNL